MTEIRRALPTDADCCGAIVRSLPEFFSPDVADAVDNAVGRGDDVRVAVASTGLVGFLGARRSPGAAEILWAAVLPARQGAGVGTALVTHLLRDLATAGIALVLVKTLDDSAAYAPYLSTRAFWRARGFVQVDTIDPMPRWEPGNPAAILVAALSATVEGS